MGVKSIDEIKRENIYRPIKKENSPKLITFANRSEIDIIKSYNEMC